MGINADFDQRVALHTDEIPWKGSPMHGVSRRPLPELLRHHGRPPEGKAVLVVRLIHEIPICFPPKWPHTDDLAWRRQMKKMMWTLH